MNTRADVMLPNAQEDSLYIEGDYVAAHASGRSVLVNPATEVEWAAVPTADEVDVDRAVEAARRAFPVWSSTTAHARASAMLRMADELEKRGELLAQTITAENGTPISETRIAAPVSAGLLRYFATLADYVMSGSVRPYPSGQGDSVVHLDPVGVCALIAPWNYPINLVMGKLAPALLAGCTTIIKPSSVTPLSIRVVVDAAAEAGIPAGVINILTGSGALGDALIAHPGIDKVAFTGSTAVGRRIAARCGELLRPVTLELGGKSSAIVLEDVDIESMSQQLIRTCLRNTGQTCYISTRILAPASRYDEIVDAVTSVIAAGRQGDPLDESTTFGPSATASQQSSVLEFIRSGIDDGFRVTTGGGKASFERGFFVTPTVFADVSPESRIAQEEIFGPVITISKYGTTDEAIRLANGTRYGLGGVVFGADQGEAEGVARRMDTGTVGINGFQPNYAAPFGGRHESGLGVEFGPEGLAAYLKPHTTHRPALV
ncbi:MAG: aldehyde dehydrogenase family protein [Microbacterium sp.]|uniref:aldehyde dehydrogenase family protein n=1 Tax=Microbacterium sp. TaxID=51671 RepID=UPI00271E7C66|nr:aldehyde dehydrogenase family protein [Microbacterium sp.]MDO8383867.1 aldehyde dehydrogenase family protein [Microbacterium sp.]